MNQHPPTPQTNSSNGCGNQPNKKQDNLSASLDDLAVVKDVARNNNGNPQQGGLINKPTSVSKEASQLPARHPTAKIPPTKRDGRKLFIGGLSSSGECVPVPFLLLTKAPNWASLRF
mmetsp:Transcript_4848/g.6632  ORF Transcript_4848/g.6632 Transcript_4848/m.6632 type:complete len:117 (+) Transcript_4848:341-691(+)